MAIPVQNEQELEDVKTHILFELTFDALERDIQKLSSMGLKLPDVYTEWLRSVQDRVVADDLLLRRNLKNAGIRIENRKRTEKGVVADYRCRGYLNRCEMTWSFARAESAKLTRAYLGVLLDEAGKARADRHAP